jgi:hypothetical protein
VNLKHIESIYDGKYQSKRQNDSIWRSFQRSNQIHTREDELQTTKNLLMMEWQFSHRKPRNWDVQMITAIAT